MPGIRFVVDAGTARVSRYAHRTGVQRLPVEPISRASADQRAGRCGRVGPGVCIRLYDEADLDTRPAYPEPEVRRSDLAAVLLRMLSLGMHDVERFPFIDPPDRRHVNDGLRLLRELGALDADDELTKVGRRLARLPLDPRIGRMLLEADSLGCVADVLVIASFLSVPDPREWSSGRRSAAQAAQGRFADTRSDFLGIVNLWRRFRSVAKDPGESMRRFCRRHALSPARMRDWLDVHGQILDICPRARYPAPRARSLAGTDPPGAPHGAASLRRRPYARRRVLRPSRDRVSSGLGARCFTRRSRRGSSPPRSWRRTARTRSWPAGSARSGWRRRPAIWCAAPTSTRTGMHVAPSPWCSSRSRSTD